MFEGRPNVFADAAGVVRTGNTVVMRIGVGRAGHGHGARRCRPRAGARGGRAAQPARSAWSRSPGRAAGWALFADRRLALAVARGSGAAVAQLGAVARQSGVPVSLHGTGGAWLVAGVAADAERFRAAVVHSLDRKVCNTLNVCCLPASRPDLVPVFLDAVVEAGRRAGASARLHVEASSRAAVPAELFEREVMVVRADGEHREPFATTIDAGRLGEEWEWEASPELTLVVVADVDEAVARPSIATARDSSPA